MVEVQLYKLVDEVVFDGFLKKNRNHIPQELLHKTLSYKFKKDQQRTLMGELMVRHYYRNNHHISHPGFEFNEHGKPFLKDQSHHFFNISHSGHYVVVAFSHHEVGVDVEMIGKDRRHIATRFFTAEEIADMKTLATDSMQIHYFYQLWTLKESYMKAVGGGMSMSLSTFSFQKTEDKFSLLYSKYDPEWFFETTKLKEEAFLSICSKSSEKPHYSSIELNSLQLI